MGDEVGVKQCPFCAEDIRAAAIKCKHCGSMLDGPPPPSGQAFRCLVCQREFPAELERCPGCQAIKGQSSILVGGAAAASTPSEPSGAEQLFHVSYWMLGWLLLVGIACAVAIAITKAPVVVGAVAVVVFLGGLVGFDF